jgi:hypothetical protein
MPPAATREPAAGGRIVAPSGTFAALPPGVQDFFGALVAAKSCRMSFEAFREEMEGSPEAEAYFAWVAAAKGSKFLSHLRKDSDALQNAP